MERDMQKIIETLQKHEADTDLLNDVMVMLLNNQIEVAKSTKKALLTAREHIENNDETTQQQIDIIRDFVVMLSEKITKLEGKL
jgi:Fic family protein